MGQVNRIAKGGIYCSTQSCPVLDEATVGVKQVASAVGRQACTGQAQEPELDWLIGTTCRCDQANISASTQHSREQHNKTHAVAMHSNSSQTLDLHDQVSSNGTTRYKR